jgi:hypothetical protein
MFARAAALSVAMSVGMLVWTAPVYADPVATTQPAQLGLVSAPAQLQFGEVAIHFGGSTQQSVTFSNESLSAVSLAPAKIDGDDSSDFQVVYDECANQTVWTGGGCRVEVRFQPQGPGEAAATLSVEALGGEGTIEVPLLGAGITGTLSANPDRVGFSAIPYTRGDREESQSEDQQIDFEAHEAGVQIESLGITGPDASSFSVQYGDCENDQLGANNWCDEDVRFQPVSPGPKHAQLVIKSDASGATTVVPLEGEGLFGPDVDLSSSESQLGEVPLGTAASHTFTVTDSGDYPLFIQQSFLVSGTPKMFPLLSNTCASKIVTPGASCEFTVGFEPTMLGEKDASLVFITNATPQINVLGVNGVGVAPTSVPLAGGLEPGEFSLPSSPELRRAGAAPKHLLAFTQASHLYSSIGRETVDTGVDAQCPARTATCQTESIITARGAPGWSRSTAQNVGRIAVLLGSRLSSLRAGEHVDVSIPLTRSAVALLRRKGHLRATIAMVIRAGGRIIAERVRTVTLTA